MSRWAQAVGGLSAAADGLQAAVQLLQGAARGGSVIAADKSLPTSSGIRDAAVGAQQAAASGFRASDARSVPAASGVQTAAVSGLQPEIDGSRRANARSLPAASGLQEAAVGGVGGLARGHWWQQLAQEWQAWHDDMEEWAETCCAPAEAILSAAHAIAESRPVAEAGEQARMTLILSMVCNASCGLGPRHSKLQSSDTCSSVLSELPSLMVHRLPSPWLTIPCLQTGVARFATCRHSSSACCDGFFKLAPF